MDTDTRRGAHGRFAQIKNDTNLDAIVVPATGHTFQPGHIQAAHSRVPSGRAAILTKPYRVRLRAAVGWQSEVSQPGSPRPSGRAARQSTRARSGSVPCGGRVERAGHHLDVRRRKR